MKKFLSVILVAVGVLMPINLWAQEVADEQVYKPYFNFEDNNLVMECGTEGANIYYALEEYSTEDEANIIAESLVVNERNTLYTAPIPITCNVVIKAIAVKQGMANSDVSVLIYNYAAWEELRKAVEYGSNVLDRAQDNPDVDDDLKQQLQWMLDESAHFYRERGMMDSHEAEYFTQRILDVAYEIEEIIGPAQSNPEPYAVLSNNNTVLTFYCDENKDRMNGMSVGPFDNNLTMGWSENLENIQRVVFDSSFADCTSLTSTAYWFDNMTNLIEIEGLEYLNVQNVTTMRMMFYGCRYLKILDLSNFVTANVTDMAWMFQDCTELVTIFVGQGWSTSEVSNGSSMFTRCTNLVGGAGTHYDADHTDYIYAHIDEGTANPGYLTDINLGPWTDPEPYAVLSNNNTVLTFYYDRNRSAFRESIDIGPFDWKTDDDNSTYRETGWSEHRESITNVMFDDSFANCTTLTSTAWWFYLCENLTTITGINNLKTDNVTDMCYMFFRCRNLAGLDVSGFKTDNVTDMHCMFGYCSSLTSLDVSRFKTDNVTNMRNMFGYCSNLTSLDVSNFNTSNVTYMDGMFDHCYSLESLDLSNFKTDKVTDMYAMFQDLSMESLDLSSFNTNNVTDMGGMFNNCSNLRTIYVGSDWSTASVGSSDIMFNACTSLVGGLGTRYDAEHTDHAYAHIDGGVPNPGYLTDINSEPWVDPEPYFVFSDNNTVLTFYYDKEMNARQGMPILHDGQTRTWEVDNMETIKNVVFDPSFADYRPISTYYWFQGFTNLISISGLEYLNTEEVTNMSGMFRDCSSLTTLDLSSFYTANVTTMAAMFNGCSSLRSLNITSFNTGEVTDMTGMFLACSSLTDLNVSNFNTLNTTSMMRMFSECAALTSLDLTNFDTDKVTNMGLMFDNCTSLTTIYASKGWSIANLTEGSDNMMFYNCINLVGGLGTTYDANHIDYTYAHIDGGTANPGYLTDKNAPRPYAVLSDNNTVLTFYYDTNMEQRNGMGVGPFTYTFINNRSNINSGWDEQRESITNVIFDASFANCTTLTSVAYWFYGFKNLTTITGISNLKTDNVTNMSGVFNGCSSLTSLDVSGFKTDNVTDMNLMFMDCSELTSLDVSGFKTDNVTNIRGIFWGCSSLTSLDVSGFKTDNVTDISVMFSNCSGLTSLDVSGFKTDNVTEMYNMFSGCSGLTSLDLSGFNTENVTLMTSMFMDCSGLTSLDLSGFKTENVTNIGLMFYGCSSLTTIYAGSEWNIAKVEDGGTLMFFGCTNLVGGAGTHYDENHVDSTYAHIDGGVTNPGYLTDINLGPWIEPEPYAVLSNNNTVLTFYYDSNKERMNGMSVGPFEWIDNNSWYDQRENIKNVVFDESFANCTTLTSTAWWFYSCNNLTSITDISNLKTDNVTNMNRMFAGCSGLRSLDVSGLKTDNVTNMAVMFAGCSGLTSLDLSGFKTDNVTDMAGMFEGCSGLTSLDLSGFKTDKVTNMSALFIRCSGLTSLDLSGFNTAQVTDMSGLFYGCSSLINVDLSRFNTVQVADMSGMFYECSSLAAIQAGNAAIPDSIYAQVANPNLLVYVNEASIAPDNVQNVVVNGVAQKIVLTDVTEGNNNWYCPLAFTAEEISYTREFQQQTEIGISRGWEGIALPFTVQTITHETQGQITPFSEQDNDMKKFWLRGYSPNGLYNVTIIEANMPYVISMPNNIVAYPEGYNLNGYVTFAASNTIVPVTPVTADMTITRGDIGMVANFLLTPQNDQVYAINVGQPRDRYAEGSVFTRGLRDVRPFEVYTTHAAINGARPNYIRIGVQPQGKTSGIQLPTVDSRQSTDKWYDLNGHRIPASKTPDSFKKGIYIQNGKKVVR